jgi:hypothetical protein
MKRSGIPVRGSALFCFDIGTMPQHRCTVINVHLGNQRHIALKASRAEFLARTTLCKHLDKVPTGVVVRDHSYLRLGRKAPREVRDDRTGAYHIL